MSGRLDWYFRQKVSESELDQGFALLEAADRALTLDASLIGVAQNAAVSQKSGVANLSVDISGPGIVYDKLGQRIGWSATQNVDVSQDENNVSTAVSTAGKEKHLSVFAKFTRVLTDLRTDGNNDPVYFSRAEGFQFVVRQGSEANVGTSTAPALDPEFILLADVTLIYGQTQVVNSDISTTRREDIFVSTGSPRSLRRGLVKNALADLLSYYNNHVTAAADKHAAADVTYAGGATWLDSTTNPAASVEAQLDKIVSDLSSQVFGTDGGKKVGAASTSGSPYSFSSGTVKSQLDALLGNVNTVYGLVSSVASTSGSPYSLSSGTLKSQIDALLGDVNAVYAIARPLMYEVHQDDTNDTNPDDYGNFASTSYAAIDQSSVPGSVAPVLSVPGCAVGDLILIDATFNANLSGSNASASHIWRLQKTEQYGGGSPVTSTVPGGRGYFINAVPIAGYNILRPMRVTTAFLVTSSGTCRFFLEGKAPSSSNQSTLTGPWSMRALLVKQ